MPIASLTMVSALCLLTCFASSVFSSAIASKESQSFLGAYTELAQEQPEFGVGFDLSASYGTAAVSFSNGTTVNIAKVSASDGYNKVLSRLSLPSSQHLAPPYNYLFAWVDDWPREMLRRARKSVGLPASQDVGYLAEMIIKLREQVQARLCHQIQAATPTSLHLIALYDEDIRDAFEYAGLELLYVPFALGRDNRNLPYHTSTTYAGYGLGLCDDYTNYTACKQVEHAMPDETVMAVLYTDTVLTVTLSVLRSAFYLYEPESRFKLDFSLGCDQHGADGRDSNYYWTLVEAKLTEIMRDQPYYPRPDKVLLMGNACLHEPKPFIKVLRRGLLSQVDSPEQMPIILGETDDDAALWAAARGAAEFAERAPYDPHRPEDFPGQSQDL